MGLDLYEFKAGGSYSKIKYNETPSLNSKSKQLPNSSMLNRRVKCRKDSKHVFTLITLAITLVLTDTGQ